MPYDDQKPPVEPLGSMERMMQRLMKQHQSIMNSFTVTQWERVEERIEMDREQREKEKKEKGELPFGESCDDCGKELGEDSHQISHGQLILEEYLCDDCYRKRYGPYKCWECGEEFSEYDIDWDRSSKHENSYICKNCSYRQQFGWD
jgi:DNA-directed RNA polymerase subunit RPC12/RpoP